MQCSDTTRLWLRTATVLHEHYRQLMRPQVMPVLPSLETLRKRLSHWKWARQHQLPTAVRHSRLALEQNLQLTILSLSNQLEILRKPARTAPTVSQLYAEIAALQEEFEHVTIDLRQRRLSVTTERIILEDLDLGPFEIQLELNHLSESSPYTVKAVDPDQSSAGHPHPHVSGQSLCEGDGKQAIATALASGLISEFFVLVRQILRTYNAGSAYRTLDEWHGVDCAACDYTISSEDAYRCDTCHCSLCGDCEYRCEICDYSMCFDCSELCEGCDDRFCRSCTETCVGCDERFCQKCLTACRCSSCSKSNEEISHERNEAIPNEEVPQPATTEAAVHAHGVVQALVPT